MYVVAGNFYFNRKPHNVTLEREPSAARSSATISAGNANAGASAVPLVRSSADAGTASIGYGFTAAPASLPLSSTASEYVATAPAPADTADLGGTTNPDALAPAEIANPRARATADLGDASSTPFAGPSSGTAGSDQRHIVNPSNRGRPRGNPAVSSSGAGSKKVIRQAPAAKDQTLFQTKACSMCNTQQMLLSSSGETLTLLTFAASR